MDATKAIMLGGALGLGAAVLLSLPNVLPRAVAEEEPMRTLLSTPNEIWPPAFDPDRLMRWSYYVQPGVSVEPVKETVVRKIGYGRTTFVNVMETASGVYSTDGLASPHIQYPGIIKEPKPSPDAGLWYWSGRKWVASAPVSAGSFVTIIPFDGGSLLTTEDGSCVALGKSVYC
ncbi:MULTISPECIES: hypothetical protein [unclassified Devosia]|jgi:hypothetical protein|uniref:hypothetical protein n=1 Tax=unclassified Devosia TaxID=196773 RepID=UPI000963EE5C|nr:MULTISPECIES: hypothetical protein [unclassified Devosia]MBN9362448.1 hypothetical protein [Devosia sp.]OJX24323.1 MAG: hypothetical protein BGO83_06730 [Devosia sp. 66-14]